MEGLLPLVYRAIKKRKIRRQYQCLSSGATLSNDMNVPEFYPQNEGHGYYMQEPSASTLNLVDDRTKNVGYLRHNSARQFSNGFSSPQRRTCSAASPHAKQLHRFGRSRSHKMFSCLALAG
ncbi:hypothetical protein VNO78_10487 [Psophocarpus tetragonolobus]|uniref:Uncharacterized protein n=1 Tax=Psophocarpus tetragonolobus TaxID=3891 RepID=A0AAN9SMG1_PSOTE